jgi:TetR/AcrR family transcriptional repressor of nem operon
MRRSRDEAAATRERIVRGAARLFRARGIDSVSVADVMAAQGLTVGGFYRHFDSKEQLIAEAIDVASTETATRQAASVKGLSPAAAAARLVGGYLSKGHVEQAASGCAVAALCSEAGHADPAVKRAFTRAVRELLDVASLGIPGKSARAREQRLHAAAAMVGAVVLARGSDDPSLGAAILAAVRRKVVPKKAVRRSRRRA